MVEAAPKSSFLVERKPEDEKKKRQEEQERHDKLISEAKAQHERPYEDIRLEVTNVYSMQQLRDAREHKLTTGCKLLDDFLRGGFPPQRLIEIYGDSRTGKTQFAFQLLLQSVLPLESGGLGGTSLFVHCGKRMNEKRYSEMQNKFLEHNRENVSEQRVKENIKIVFVQDVMEYKQLMQEIDKMVRKDKIKLFVLDNIAELCNSFSRNDSSIDYIERSQFL